MRAAFPAKVRELGVPRLVRHASATIEEEA